MSAVEENEDNLEAAWEKGQPVEVDRTAANEESKENSIYVDARENGMTHEEADAYSTLAEAARKCLSLDSVHPMEKQVLAEALHRVQFTLIARPTYRKMKTGYASPPNV